MLTLTILGALSTLTIWFLVVTFISVFITLRVIKNGKLKETGYDYTKIKDISNLLSQGRSVELDGIDTKAKFFTFLFEIEFVDTGIKRKIIYAAPQGDRKYYVVKLIDQQFKTSSDLST